MLLDRMPIWGVLVANLVLVFVALELGVRFGRMPLLRSGARLEVSGPMVAATMALLTFMLAFTFNGAAGRHDARKHLVLEEANVIETTWLRAGFLAEPQRSEVRGLLRDYVDLRIKAATGKVPAAAALQQSEAMHTRMWNTALEVGRQHEGSVMAGLFVQSMNDVFDLHVKRVTLGIRSRVPQSVWVALHILMFVGMMMIGMQLGLSGTRHYGAEIALGVSFAMVLFLIVDLDRPQEGFIHVSQQPMIEMQARLEGH